MNIPKLNKLHESNFDVMTALGIDSVVEMTFQRICYYVTYMTHFIDWLVISARFPYEVQKMFKKCVAYEVRCDELQRTTLNYYQKHMQMLIIDILSCKLKASSSSMSL